MMNFTILIDLHPQKAIQDLKSECQIDNLIDEVAFEEIFYDFFKYEFRKI